MFGLIEELKKDKKEKSVIAEIFDEMAAGAAAILGAATGLTAKESKAFLQNKKTEEVADKVAIAQDLENISRQQQQDGLTETKNTQTAKAARVKQELDLNIKTT